MILSSQAGPTPACLPGRVGLTCVTLASSAALAASAAAQSGPDSAPEAAVADMDVPAPSTDQWAAHMPFSRVMGAPGDRNLVSLSANLGVVMQAPFADRCSDSVGLDLAYIRTNIAF